MLRLKVKGNHLEEKDYVTGFGLHTTHYFEVCKAREAAGLPTRKDFKDDYDLREGCGITGEPFNTRPHPLLGKRIKSRKTGEEYVIEAVYKHFDYGFYWTILIRREGTQSHGTLWWENITCKYDLIVNDIEENRNEFFFL
jgi:hypothetical protein